MVIYRECIRLVTKTSLQNILLNKVLWAFKILRHTLSVSRTFCAFVLEKTFYVSRAACTEKSIITNAETLEERNITTTVK
jgi:hypothetical protein